MNGTPGRIFSNHGGDSLSCINALLPNDELEPIDQRAASVKVEENRERLGIEQGVGLHQVSGSRSSTPAPTSAGSQKNKITLCQN